MAMDLPTFSIIVPTYNRANMLVKLINSFLKINYPKVLYEIIVVDDGSNDNTRNILENFSTKIKFYSIKNSERGYARNYGASKSKFEYLNFFDSDDICLPNHLICAAASIITYNFPEFIAQGFQLRNENDKVYYSSSWKLYESLNKQLYKNIIGCDGVFIRQDIAKENKFSEDRKLSGSEDWYLWFQLAHKYKLHSSPAITHYGIEHKGRSIYKADLKQISEKTKILINLIKNFKNPNDKIDLKSLSITYLKLDLCQYLTANKKIINKIKGVIISSFAFWANPSLDLLKLYILCLTNCFNITKSR